MYIFLLYIFYLIYIKYLYILLYIFIYFIFIFHVYIHIIHMNVYMHAPYIHMYVLKHELLEAGCQWREDRHQGDGRPPFPGPAFYILYIQKLKSTV